MEHYVNLYVCENGGQPIRTVYWVSFKPFYSHGDFLPAIEMYLADYVDDSGMISLRYDCSLLVYVNFYVRVEGLCSIVQ